MKLTAILLTITCLQVAASGNAQHITIDMKEAPVQRVFKEISRQSGLSVIYAESLFKNAPPVTIKVKDATLQQAMEKCLKDLPFSYELVNNTIVVKQKPATTNDPVIASDEGAKQPLLIDVTGRVTDSSGAPLQNASIRVRGTKQGTTSDANGYFILKGVDENATIEISYQGFELYSVKASANIGTVGLKMKENELDVVTVEANTGYQKVKPNEINGSIFVVTKEMLNQQTSPNILDRLNGVTSSMLFNIGKSGNDVSRNPFSIRGLSTINGSTDPLIVLDNFIFEGNIENINPDDVENITILKDAAAASIWGARAGNGVIVITTKKGRFIQKLSVEFSSKITSTNRPDLFYQPQMSLNDLINVEENIFNKGYFDAEIIAGQTPGDDRDQLTPVVEVLLKRRNGLITAGDSAQQINALKNTDSRKQYEKYFYRDGLTQQYSVGVTGGSSNMAWRMSTSFNKAIGNLRGVNDKINVLIGNNYKISKNLFVDVSVNYTNSKATDGIRGNYRSTITMNNRSNRQMPYLPLVDENGKSLAVPRYRQGYIDTAGGGRLLNWDYYPLEEYKHDKTTSNLQEMIASVGLNYRFLKNFQVKVDYQYQNQWVLTEQLAGIESYYTRNLINRFTQLGSTQANNFYAIPIGAIFEQSYSYRKSQNFRTQLNYNKEWNGHAVSSIIGTEIRNIVSRSNGSGFFGYVEDPLSYGIVNSTIPYPTYITGAPEFISGAASVSTLITDRFVSIYGNLAYTYKEKYSASASARKDASNVFGASTNDKWNPLWSSGIGWVVSKEKFYQSKWLSYLKAKVTFGYSGNVDVVKTPLPIISSSGLNPYINLPALSVSQINNPSLRWEKSRQINLGFDFATTAQLISGSLEFFFKKGTDLYGPTPYDYSAWGSSPTLIKNIANMEGKGVDIVVRSKNLNNELKWQTSFLFNYNISKTTAYFDRAAQNYYIVGNENRIYPIVGKPLYSVAAYKWGGLNADGDPQGYLDGQLSTDYAAILANVSEKGLEGGSVVYIGPSNPPVFGSIINSFDWKGISFSFNISYKLGYYFRRPAFTSNALINNGFGHADYAKRWQNVGDEAMTDVPAFVYTDYPQFERRDLFYSSSEVNVLKADNIRLQYLNIGYSFNSRNGKFPFKQLQLSLNAANIAIIWKAAKEKIDPDFIYSPSPKQFTIGVRGNF